MTDGVDPGMDASALAGDPLGSGYRLYERIGSGAMGEVRRGTTLSGEPVAVKILRPELASDAGLVARFLQERGILTGLTHPNVVSVRDLVAEGGQLAIVMDLVDGHDLRTELDNRGTLPPAEAATLVASALRGLAAVHAAGVIHRDLKPENILLDGVDPGPAVPKVSDFGISKIVNSSTSGRRTSVIGTPEYMAPELIDDSDPTQASDLYAVGIVLYELLCGVTPFRGGSPLAVLRRHAEATPGRPPQIPDQMWEIISHLLDKEPSARPQSAALVATALDSLTPQLATLPAAAKLAEPPAAAIAGATVVSSIKPTRVSEPTAQESTRSRLPLIAAAVAAVVLIGGGAALALSRSSGDTAAADPSATQQSTSSTPSADPTTSAPTPSDTPTESPSESPTITSSSPVAGAMPNVVGSDFTAAQAQLTALGITAVETPKLVDDATPEGQILEQSTQPGEVVSGTVTLTVGRHATTTWLADTPPVAGYVDTEPVKMNGKDYVHPVGQTFSYCNDGATWEYDLGKRYLTLGGLIGLSDESDSQSVVVVEMYKDGTRVLNQKVRLGKTAAFKINVSEGLRLQVVIKTVTCGGQEFRVALADPKLTGLPTTPGT